jgi:DNA-binding CsgD family transcriptional regulator
MSADEPRALLLHIAEQGLTAPSLPIFRQRTLALLRERIPFDVAIFHALSPRVGLETAALVGIAPEEIAGSMHSWDDLAVELGTLRELAERNLAVSDEEAYPRGTAARKRLRKLVLRPFGMGSFCVLHLHLRGALRAAVVLMARRGAAFGPKAVAVLREIAPVLAVADALLEGLDGIPRRSTPVQLVCADERLTARQRKITEHVALGHSNAEIAAALGISPHTLRNHLVRIFGRVGAANRADLVRLAVLVPNHDGVVSE